MTTAATPTEPTPGWVVAVLGVLLLALAGLGFALSFQMMLPVMVIAGWSVAIAWGGPVLIDLAAASGALMQMVSKDGGIRRWGVGVLGFSTLLSICMNLAGHSIQRDGHGLPEGYAGMRLGDGWQWVVILMSIATPLFIAVLVHAFGHVLMAHLGGRQIQPVADRESGRVGSVHPTAAAPDPTGKPTRLPVSYPTDPTSAPDSSPNRLADRSNRTRWSGADPEPADPTRLASDSTADLRESGESGTRLDSDSHPTPDPTADPTDLRVGYPTDPTRLPPEPTGRPTRPDSHPTESADPTRPTTRPDSESGTDLTDPELTRLVERARELVESGELRLTAEAIRVTLRVGQERAKKIRDALKHNQRHGLRAVS